MTDQTAEQRDGTDSFVWVVTNGDSVTTNVIGVAATPELGRALAEAHHRQSWQRYPGYAKSKAVEWVEDADGRGWWWKNEGYYVDRFPFQEKMP